MSVSGFTLEVCGALASPREMLLQHDPTVEGYVVSFTRPPRPLTQWSTASIGGCRPFLGPLGLSEVPVVELEEMLAGLLADEWQRLTGAVNTLGAPGAVLDELANMGLWR